LVIDRGLFGLGRFGMCRIIHSWQEKGKLAALAKLALHADCSALSFD
jgi:hypothetical protein